MRYNFASVIMLAIILLTGKQGSGKSYVAREVLPHQQIVAVDELVKGSPDFDFWGCMEPEERLRRLIGSLRSRYADLSTYRLPIVIEGAILCVPEFTHSMLEAIAIHLGREMQPVEVKRFYLNPSNEVICSQVHRRIKDEPWRRKELSYLATPDAVATCHRHFDELMTRPENVRWIHEADSFEMVTRIKKELSVTA
jgi:hypothetical protein